MHDLVLQEFKKIEGNSRQVYSERKTRTATPPQKKSHQRAWLQSFVEFKTALVFQVAKYSKKSPIFETVNSQQ